MYKSIMPPLSEDQIERVVERETNRLDRLFMSEQLSQTEYDREMSDLGRWAQDEYQRRHC